MGQIVMVVESDNTTHEALREALVDDRVVRRRRHGAEQGTPLESGRQLRLLWLLTHDDPVAGVPSGSLFPSKILAVAVAVAGCGAPAVASAPAASATSATRSPAASGRRGASRRRSKSTRPSPTTSICRRPAASDPTSSRVISPTFRVARNGPRLQVNFDYTPQYLYYAQRHERRIAAQFARLEPAGHADREPADVRRVGRHLAAERLAVRHAGGQHRQRVVESRRGAAASRSGRRCSRDSTQDITYALGYRFTESNADSSRSRPATRARSSATCRRARRSATSASACAVRPHRPGIRRLEQHHHRDRRAAT